MVIFLMLVVSSSFGESLKQEPLSKVKKNIHLSYVVQDFCFASPVKNCQLHGYEASLFVQIGSLYGFLSAGEIRSINGSSKMNSLDVLYAEGGGGVYLFFENMKFIGQLSYYSAGETETHQSNSNFGPKVKLILGKNYNLNMDIGLSATYDGSQNSADIRDHNSKGSKPKMNFVRGGVYARYNYKNGYSLIFNSSKIIKRASSRRTTEGDLLGNRSSLGANYKISLEKSF